MKWHPVLVAGLLLTLALVETAMADAGRPVAAPREEARQVMGTVATVQAWANAPEQARAGIDAAFAVFAAVDSGMSTWNGNSTLSRLNRMPVGAWLEVGPDLARVLSTAQEVARVTDGAFDPTVLPLVRLWGFRGGPISVPLAAEVAAVRARVDYTAIEIKGQLARRTKVGVAVDLGGIAKGYALDQAELAMRACGVVGGVLDLGGNLLVFGQGPARRVGVEDPGRPGSLAMSLPLVAGAVASSGQYENFHEMEGVRRGHILDPRTGWPAAAGLSATVVAERAIRADALATAVVVLGREAGLALLERLPGVEGAVVDGEGVAVTSGLVAGMDRGAE